MWLQAAEGAVATDEASLVASVAAAPRDAGWAVAADWGIDMAPIPAASMVQGLAALADALRGNTHLRRIRLDEGSVPKAKGALTLEMLREVLLPAVRWSADLVDCIER